VLLVELSSRLLIPRGESLGAALASSHLLIIGLHDSVSLAHILLLLLALFADAANEQSDDKCQSEYSTNDNTEDLPASHLVFDINANR